MAQQLSRGAVERGVMIVAGFGFRTAAHADSLRQAYDAACVGLQGEVTTLATVFDKAQSDVFAAFVTAQNLPVVAVPQSVVSGTRTPTQSLQSHAARQTGSVAEAVALAAAGPGATLLQSRVISEDRCATCAIAQSAEWEDMT